MLQRIKSVLEVIWRRSCNIFETQTKERYYYPPEPPTHPPKTRHLQKWQVPPIERRHQKRARGTRWLPTGDNLGGNPVPDFLQKCFM